MDGAYVTYEAFDMLCSRLVWWQERRARVTVAGPGIRADLGSSSIKILYIEKGSFTVIGKGYASL